MMSPLTYSGMVVPPVIWIVMMQLGQTLPYADCRLHTAWTLLISVVGIVLSLVASAVSRRTATRLGTRYSLFLGNLAFLIGLAFSFALILQGAAAALIDPCLH